MWNPEDLCWTPKKPVHPVHLQGPVKPKAPGGPRRTQWSLENLLPKANKSRKGLVEPRRNETRSDGQATVSTLGDSTKIMIVG